MNSKFANKSIAGAAVLTVALTVAGAFSSDAFAGSASRGRGWSVSPTNIVAGIGSEENVLRLVTGKSIVLKMQNSIRKVSVANPETADVVLINEHQLQVNALKTGETAVIVWDRLNNYKMYSLIIADSLHEQVVLEVTVAEVNRTEAERHGFDLRTMGGRFGAITQYGNVAPTGGVDPPTGSQPTFPVSLGGEISWAIVDFKNDIAAYVKMIEEADFAHILAEPKLMARSGQKAKFLSGGELPIVIAENDQTTIEYKEFGTRVEFQPTVEPDGMIRLTVMSEVSAPDPGNSVILNSFSVPAFVTRRAETDVSLMDGQSLVIAGLMRETSGEVTGKMPFFGDIPVLGYFFRSSSKTREKTELVIIIQPHIVRGDDSGAGTGLEKRTNEDLSLNQNGSLGLVQRKTDVIRQQ